MKLRPLSGQVDDLPFRHGVPNLRGLSLDVCARSLRGEGLGCRTYLKHDVERRSLVHLQRERLDSGRAKPILGGAERVAAAQDVEEVVVADRVRCGTQRHAALDAGQLEVGVAYDCRCLISNAARDGR